MSLPIELIAHISSYVEPNDWLNISLANKEYYAVSKCNRKRMLLIKFCNEKFESDVNWKIVSSCKKLNEQFISEFVDKVD